MNNLNNAEKILEDVEKEVEDEIKIKPLHLSELMKKEFDEVEWLIDGLIPLDSTVAFSGAPATFKTWLAIHMALKIASGGVVFNHFNTRQTGVLIIDEESGERLLHPRFKMQNNDSDLPIHYLSLAGFKVEKRSVDSIISFAKENNVGFVILDSLVRIHNAKENDAQEMASVFDCLKQFNKVGITVLFTHHHRKQMGFSSNVSQEMRGSSDILASVDVHLAVQRKDDCIVFNQTKMRYAEELKPFKVNIINEEEKMDFEFGGDVDEVSDKKEEFKTSIKAMLETENQPLYKTELFNKLKEAGLTGGHSTFKTAVGELVKESVVYEQKGERNKIYLSLKPSDEAEEVKKLAQDLGF